MKQIDGRTSLNEGKRITNVNGKNWEEAEVEAMKKANKAKFDQNEGLRITLMATKEDTLVECSPRDRKWGIGHGLHSEEKYQEALWGDNQHGEVLMFLRSQYKEGIHVKMDQ